MADQGDEADPQGHDRRDLPDLRTRTMTNIIIIIIMITAISTLFTDPDGRVTAPDGRSRRRS
jgi:hypothetical protein